MASEIFATASKIAGEDGKFCALAKLVDAQIETMNEQLQALQEDCRVPANARLALSSQPRYGRSAGDIYLTKAGSKEPVAEVHYLRHEMAYILRYGKQQPWSIPGTASPEDVAKALECIVAERVLGHADSRIVSALHRAVAEHPRPVFES
jgi:hypothetical protein